ncbi:MAG TPA: aminotransferase class V-fold PLP-dependent enzyme [Acidimicrobiales bacterium]|nr:aminotransferase class V-fold PLP-dependent enzyme [Acidimicrobiales bacterium]
MHTFDESAEALARAIFDYALARVRMDPPPLDGTRRPEELEAVAGRTITPDGLGGLEALRVFVETLAPATISIDHPRFFAFVPAAPTEASILFDLVVGASSIYGGSWLEGAGAVFAENQALRWLADLAGFPPGSGGVFVAGGTAANLSALVAARETWRARNPGAGHAAIAVSDAAHSSIAAAARVMDVPTVVVPTDEKGRLTGAALDARLDAAGEVFAVVATAGTTNGGFVDDLAGIASVAGARGVWFHVDGAYGLAALAARSARHLFVGVERADSFCVDPHKWLFAPFDCAALVYRDPALARAAHTQHAAYLDVLHATPDWNPSDYAFHLTRRARGLPFWFSLATHGTDAYSNAIEATLSLTRAAARMIDAHPSVELIEEPELSVVLFRRTGWTPADYTAWSDRVLAEGLTLTVPTKWHDETCLRFCFVNPRTTKDDVALVLDSL